MQAYQSLEKLFRHMYHFEHLAALADWDMNVNMPPKGEESRGDALAAVLEHIHSLLTSSDSKKWVEEANAAPSSTFSATQLANLREMTRLWRQSNLLPNDFVERKARLTTKAHMTWKESRAANNFASFLPVLKELVAVAREEGGYLAQGTNITPYEALMQLYEPGLTIATLDAIFGKVKAWLPELLQRILAKQKGEAAGTPFPSPMPLDKQEALGRGYMKVWDFDFEGGRLDVSPHPFTGMTQDDCRVTTNYNEEVLAQSLYGIIHETGHAKYEQNCGPREMRGLPVCMARSLGIHESQSLFAEFQIGRATSFLTHLAATLPEHFGQHPSFSVENVRKLFQHVEPSYIRVDADEVCYPLHVILRYEIERDLVSGKMEAEEVPAAWNQKMKAYLGLETTGKDNLGCLQDVHWSQGAMGYFPTYALGSMYAAQLMATIKKELGAAVVDDCLRQGTLGPILAKQKEKIWDHGSLFETDELVQRATGETLNPDFLRKHLEERYLA